MLTGSERPPGGAVAQGRQVDSDAPAATIAAARHGGSSKGNSKGKVQDTFGLWQGGGDLVTGEHWQASVASSGEGEATAVRNRTGARGVASEPPATTNAESSVPSRSDAQAEISVQPPASQYRRINEDGDSLPGSQDSALAEQARSHWTIGDSSMPTPALTEPEALDRASAVRQEHEEMRRSVISDARAGRLTCPFCDSFSGSTASGLMRHLSCMHAGHQLGDDGVIHLTALRRGVCESPGCGFSRRFGDRHCSRCSQTVGIRALTPDVVIAAPPRRRFEEEMDQSAPPDPADVPVDVPGLPHQFHERVRRLGRHTIVHTPFSVRAKTCEVIAGCLEEALDGGAEANVLMEALPALIYAPAPKGASNATELKLRLGMWGQRDFEQLFARVESQHFERHQQFRKKSSPQVEVARRHRKAKQHAANSALGKAVQALGEGPAVMPACTQRRWAERLLPRSARPVSALSPAPAVVPLSEPFETQAVFGTDASEHPLKGVRVSAETAPGPSGLRPEHIQEALMAKSRPVTGKLLRAIGRLEKLGLSGSLPDRMRWMLRSRLVFLKKRTARSLGQYALEKS